MDQRHVDLPNGTRLRYLERRGPGPAVVVLHGITDTADSYRPPLADLAPGPHVYALDHRGHGGSSKPESPYTTDAYADDVRAFIRSVAAGPVLLAGHSLGGLVAVQVAATAPDLVRALFLEDPPLYFVNNLSEVYRSLFNGLVVMATTLQDGSKTPEEWFDVMKDLPDPFTGEPVPLDAERLRDRVAAVGQMKPKALQDALDGGLEWDTDAVLRTVRCPVHLVTGRPELGAVMTPAEAERAAGLMPRVTHTYLEDVGHLVHQDAPGRWLELLSRWIAEEDGN